jgi:hypothetical protein
MRNSQRLPAGGVGVARVAHLPDGYVARVAETVRPTLSIPQLDASLREFFDNELALTRWLADEALFELTLNLGAAGLLPGPQGLKVDPRCEVRCPTGRADIVLQDEDNHAVCVIEAQLGTADADHLRRLLLDYCAHLRPRAVALICEQWSPVLDHMLAYASVPAGVFELETHAVANGDRSGIVLVMRHVRSHYPGLAPEADAISVLRAEVEELRGAVGDATALARGEHIGGCEGGPDPNSPCPCGAWHPGGPAAVAPKSAAPSTAAHP